MRKGWSLMIATDTQESQVRLKLSHTFTVSASSDVGASAAVLLSPGPLPIKKLTSRSLSQLSAPPVSNATSCEYVKRSRVCVR